MSRNLDMRAFEGSEGEYDTPSLLSNDDIDKLLSTKSSGKPLKYYAGCFMKHQLEDMSPENDKIYIINLDEKGGSGTHWVLVSNLTKCNKRQIVYFNSFGLPPPDVILRFMKRAKDSTGKKKEVLYNTCQIQDIESVNCGYYCVWVVKQLCRGNSMADILGRFHIGFDKWYNEHLINELKKSAMFAVIRE